MVKAICTALLSLFVVVNNAQASFIDYGTYSYDTKTGLDWLDTTKTAGLSYSAVKAGAGGWLSSGWRYATGAEVRDLFQFYIGTGPEVFYPSNTEVAWNFALQMGVNLSFNNNLGVRQIYGANEPTQISIDALFDDGTNNSFVGIGELIARLPSSYSTQPGTGPGSRWVVYDDFWYLPGSLPSWGYGYGSFLVREASQVPEPSSLLLMLSAGFGLVGAVRSRESIKRQAAIGSLLA